ESGDREIRRNPQPDVAGGFEIVDANGVVRFTIPTPVMWDSSGVEGEREPESAPVAVGSCWPTTLDPRFRGNDKE
ncbi:MAG TPA: hypothetical protein PLY73_15115, partial [Candidatus Ozemobacteraceae bacterium]|nr:hypothetical protein [Candidatus Ozemobacteraceae bacterium]